MAYRRDIDGLRAVSVLAVVLYHYGLGVRGGYVGVDVFFVISGYLIARHIREELDQHCFSLRAFYERRIRRILPALFFMLAAVLAASLFVLFPPDIVSLSRQTPYVVAFLANIRFYWDFGGYANQGARQAPLLHTWSLAVEEQFYLVFPLLMIALRRLDRIRYGLVVGAIALVSFLWSLAAVQLDQAAAFYLPQYRVWEFALGALASTGGWPAVPQRACGSVAALGVAMIVTSALLYSDGTLYPGIFALLPCLGGALVLCAPTQARSAPGLVLQNQVFVRLGQSSYSLYLWHWPVLVLAHYYFGSLSGWQSALLLALNVPLAALSCRFVEIPFRFGRLRACGSRIWLGALSAAALLSGSALTLHYNSNVAARLGFERQIAFPRLTGQQQACQALLMKAAGNACHLGADDAVPDTLVWGDSYAFAMVPGVHQAFAAQHRAAYLISNPGCPPLLQTDVRTFRHGVDELSGAIFVKLAGRRSFDCVRINADVLNWLDSHRVRNVILMGRWAYYAGPDNDAVASEPMLLSEQGKLRKSPASNPVVFARGLEQTLQALTSRSIGIFVMAGLPEYRTSVPYEMALRTRRGSPGPITMPSKRYRDRQAVIAAILAGLRQRNEFTLLDPQAVLCAGLLCTATHDGEPLYMDGIHLSPLGSELVMAGFGIPSKAQDR